MAEKEECQCKHDNRIAQLERKDIDLAETFAKFENKLDLIISRISKIEVLEERHNHHSDTISRLFVRMESNEVKIAAVDTSAKDRHDKLAEEARAFINSTKGMMKVFYSLFTVLGGAVFVLLVKVLFFAAHNGMTP